MKDNDRIKKAQALRLIRKNLHLVVAPVAVKSKYGNTGFKAWRRAAVKNIHRLRRKGKLCLD